jgi:glycosyltransferase involved in cell wall biosynthesis
VGPKFGREKVLYMKLGHAFLMPSLVGLAILDAFALGLPLFTTDCKLHGPEISYLQDSRNGYMTPNSVESYASAVIDILRNRPKLDLMKESCKLDAEKYTLEEMVDSFASGLLSCLS